MEAHEVERLRRSVAMLPPGHSAGALGREQALELCEELARVSSQSRRYRVILNELRDVLNHLDEG